MAFHAWESLARNLPLPTIMTTPAPSAKLAIEAQALVKTYPPDVRALDGLTFVVRAGSIFGLLGPNGAGKSTTVKILNTLSRPDSGLARVAGIDVVKAPDAVRRVIGCVAQKSGVDINASGRENLTLQGQFYGLGGAALRARVTTLLEQFSLAAAADREARTYSGGMKRKLDVAMGLIHEPTVLFLDEPTTGLDPEARADLWREIERLARGQGITILLTTHYLEEADQLADRLAIVDRGRVVAEGTPDGLKSELSGDAIQVDLVEAIEEGRVRAALGGLSALREVAAVGIAVRARADHGGAAVPGMITALEAAGARVASVRVTRPSLDDVYLQHTGRSFSEADQGGAR
jgi:ABC-2 type transport system ATP-binding protein